MKARKKRAARILLLMPGSGAGGGGGIHRVGCSLIRLLGKERHAGRIDYRVLSLGSPDGNAEDGSLDKTLRERAKWYGGHRIVFSMASMAAMAFWADVVMITHIGLASPLFILPRTFRPASITFIHGIEVWRHLRLRHRLSLRRSDFVVANSQFTIRKAGEHNPWLRNARTCHLGIPLGPSAAPRQVKEALGFAPGRTTFSPSADWQKGNARRDAANCSQPWNGSSRRFPTRG